jgi:outer membrane protein assembly factor BamE (lipoprotein component of BamABCDE complex)
MNSFRLACAAAAAAATAFVAGCATGPIASLAPAGAGVRTDATFARIASGMPEAEVSELLGRPDETMRFPLSRNVAWDYRYYDTWGYLAIFSVTFGPDGRVVSTISNRINSGGDHAGSK